MRLIIIGSGIAGITFAEKYRALSPTAQITLLTQENDGYYSRPLLSHGFSKAEIESTIILKPFEKIQEKNINIISAVEVTDINRNNQTVSYNDAETNASLTYDKLILAMGSAAFIPPPLLPFKDQFFLLNNLADLKKLRTIRQSLLNQNMTPRWAVIGGGLIGCEIASDLAKCGDNASLYHMMDRLMERQLVKEDSDTLLKVMKSASVNILLEQNVQGFQNNGQRMIVNVAEGKNDDFDAVIVCCGFKPRTELALKADLEIARGIKVNQFLQTSDENIYALGDVAELPNSKLYAFILPIRNQAIWLANYLNNQDVEPWSPPTFTPKAKVHGFDAANSYIF